MNSNLNEVILIVDNSGSMGPLVESTCSGINELVSVQKKAEAEVRLSIVLFNEGQKTLVENKNVKNMYAIKKSKIRPDGMTALCDSVCKVIDSVGERLSSTPEEERPSKVLVVIITDGHENASTCHTFKDVRERIQHQREKYSWEFAFIGANIATEEYGKELGIPQVNTVTYTASQVGNCEMYRGLTKSISAYLATGSADMQSFMGQ